MYQEQWIKELSVGDKVFSDTGHIGENLTLEYVVKITPSGIVKTSRTPTGNPISEYNPDGRQRGCDRYYGSRLVPYTQTRVDRLEHDALANKMNGRTPWDKLSLDQLRRINAIIQEGNDVAH